MANIEKIRISLPSGKSGSYEIHIGQDLDFGKLIKKLCPADRYAVITDRTVRSLHGKRLSESLSAAGLKHRFFSFHAGEKRKNIETFEKISDSMLKKGFDRGSAVIAFGGGVPGDLAGFVAGCFMRGIPFVQIPTTLLAMVDSSIGGKVAIDLPSGKNSAGLFYQPEAVLTDTAFLSTLPKDEFLCGMAEAIKHGIILDPEYFKLIEDNISAIRNHRASPELLVKIVRGSCRIKAGIVMKDEKESGLRRKLNFGHTIGHGLERLSKYKLAHGSAVSAGMLMESSIAVQERLLNKNDFLRIKAILRNLKVRQPKFKVKRLLKRIVLDKKNRRTGEEIRIPIVLPTRIGDVIIREFLLPELRKLLSSI